MNRLALACVLLVLAGCRDQAGPQDSLDAIARDYVLLSLTIGEKEEGYIDAYYGPPELQARPALAGDEAKVEAFAFGKGNMFDGASLALRNGHIEHRLQLVRRDGEALLKSLDALSQRAGARDELFNLFEQRVIARKRLELRPDCKQTLGLVFE